MHGSLAIDIFGSHQATASKGGVSRRQRHRNINGAFSIGRDRCKLLAGRPVVLVDDVMTTGATLFTAGKCLSAVGSGPVSALVVAAWRDRASLDFTPETPDIGLARPE